MISDFWQGKRVFVTGHTGFKGGWLSMWLRAMGSEVHGYALEPPTEPSMFDACGIGDGMNSVIGEIRDLDRLKAAVLEARPEIVFHLAAQPLVRLSYERPLETYETNVIGTANLLETVRECKGVRAVVVVTTDKCYENREWEWGYREIDRLGGHDPYSSSKACAELVAAAYRDSYFPPDSHSEHGTALATARAGNVIGGGDWALDRLVPDTVRAIVEGRPIVIRYPHAIRPWQHVLEPLNGYMMLAQRLWEDGPEFGEAWNFGPEDEAARTVADVVGGVAESWGGGARWDLAPGDHAHETSFLRLDSSKAHSGLGWWPYLTFDDGIDWTVEWYRAHASGEDVRALTEVQIRRFSAICSGNAIRGDRGWETGEIAE